MRRGLTTTTQQQQKPKVFLYKETQAKIKIKSSQVDNKSESNEFLSSFQANFKNQDVYPNTNDPWNNSNKLNLSNTSNKTYSRYSSTASTNINNQINDSNKVTSEWNRNLPQTRFNSK